MGGAYPYSLPCQSQRVNQSWVSVSLRMQKMVDDTFFTLYVYFPIFLYIYISLYTVISAAYYHKPASVINTENAKVND